MVHFRLSAVVSLLFLTTTLAVANRLPNGLSNAVLPEKLAKLNAEPSPKVIQQFHFGTAKANQICKQWQTLANTTLSQDPNTKGITSQCEILDSKNSILGSYASQLRKDGSTWSYTGPLGHRLKLVSVVSKPKGVDCSGDKQVATGYCETPQPNIQASQLSSGGESVVGPGGSPAADGPETSGARRVRSVFSLLF